MNAAISYRILTAIENGMSIEAAFDFVLGAGSYAKLASDLYDSLRA